MAFFAEGVFTDADEVEGLAIAFDKLGLVVEGVDMAGSAGHEEEDDALGPSGKDGRFWGEGGGLCALTEEGGEGE